MKRPAICLAALFGACQQAVPVAVASSLSELVAAHAEARGGAAAVEAVDGIEAWVRITEPTFTVDGHYRALQDGRMRIDVYADGVRVFTEALDGEAGWQMRGGAVEGSPISTAGEDALRRGVLNNVHGLHELPALGVTLKAGVPEAADGLTYDVIEAQHPDGFSRRYYLDHETHLIAKIREESALHPDIDPETQRFESQLSDYREVSGVHFNFRSTKIDLDTGRIAAVDEVRSIVVNPKIDPAIFERP